MQTEINYLKIQYNCPRCNRQSNMNIPFVKGEDRLQIEKKGFCSNQYCKVQHHFKYKVLPEEDNWNNVEPKVLKFLVENEEKQIQMLGYSTLT